MKKRILILFFLFIGYNSFAQREFSNWYFGQRAGLNFGEGDIIPQALLDGEIEAVQGCATISDSDGNLLFYTNGETIWDKTHNVMFNGENLAGNRSNNQAAAIVPKPGNPNIYYVITTSRGTTFTNDGLKYSEVDLRLNNGNGGVTENKNILINPDGDPDGSHNLKIVQHKNNRDFWIITHARSNRDYIVHRVTEDGIDTEPIISSIGREYGFFGGERGQIKVSPNGERIASRVTIFIESPDFFRDSDFLQILDFNTSTGIISGNPIISNRFSIPFRTGNIEFSPNSEFIYMSSRRTLVRFNANTNSPEELRSSTRRLILPNTTNDLQLGIDGKIYVSLPGQTFLGVIERPDDEQINYNTVGVPIIDEENGGRFAMNGLPQLITGFFYLNIDTEQFCFGRDTEFSLFTGENVLSVVWDFGDGTTSTELTPTHMYQAPGTYTIVAEVTTDEGVEVVSETLVLTDVPVADDIGNVAGCVEENDNGIQILNLTNFDSLVLGNQSESDFNVDYYLTEEDAINRINVLDVMFENTTNPQQLFTRIESRASSDCFDIGSLIVDISEGPELELDDLFFVCEDSSIEIDAGSGFDSYLWSTGEMTQSIIISEPGDYDVTVGLTSLDDPTLECTTTEAFVVEQSGLPASVTIEVLDLTQNNSIRIEVEGIGDYEYSIDGISYQDDPFFDNLFLSEYTVFIRDKNGCGEVTEDAFLLTVPSFFTPNNDGVNDLWQVNSSFAEPDLNIQIFDRYGKLLINFNGLSSGWDGTFNGQQLPVNDYWYKIERPSTGTTHVGHFTLKR